MNSAVRLIAAMVICLIGSDLPSAAGADDHPLSRERREAMESARRKQVAQLTKAIEESPSVGLYSRRGDARFFLGEFRDALADYEKMVELNPDSGPSHWRRGIARFYAGQYQAAAKQFEEYHSFDNVDRENGIWRYLSQRKAYGLEKAREGLLKYEKTDREPFPAVYELFAGRITPGQILSEIAEADIDERERSKREFYAHLYIGLNHAVEGRSQQALTHLRKATASPWPQRAGFGPDFMWHVGRLHYERLVQQSSADSSSQ